MHLINVQAFTQREQAMNKGENVAYGTKVLEFRGDEVTDYAILSHRWIEKEVDYKEAIKLAKMNKQEQDDIRQCDGYRKILASCEQAKKDGYDWLWVDTCCIDKQSSAELSEAINSMYRWYKNSKVCYAYLHDVSGPSFPTECDEGRYPNSDGWPEWFSRGWTLQEMIAPGNVQFFNQDWQSVGNKRSLASTLEEITGVPKDILRDGLSSNRPCVARIMSWAANRTTTRVEDRAYSLLGLLDVNMPMLYGEGRKAFHRLQLEIIRVSDDQSIFAWGAGPFGDGGRTGSILADDPSFFRDCGYMKLMPGPNAFIECIRRKLILEDDLHSIKDQLSVFPTTNRGIHIWMLLIPLENLDSVFEAWLPCWDEYDDPVRIKLVLWNSNYYRYCMPDNDYLTSTPQYRQVYLRYQDLPHSDVTFQIDDGAITSDGFTCCTTHRDRYEDYSDEEDEAEEEDGDDGNTLTLASTESLCVRVYSNSQNDCGFAVGFGQCFGEDWIHVYKSSTEKAKRARDRNIIFRDMLLSGPDYARSLDEARDQHEYHGRVWVKYFGLPQSSWTVQISCVLWHSSRNRGVKIEVFRHSYNGPKKWIGFDADGTDDPNCDVRSLMIRQDPWDPYWLVVDEDFLRFSRAPGGTKVGNYGYITDHKDFHCEGNIFDDLRSVPWKPDITPRKDRIRSDKDSGYVEASNSKGSVRLYDPIMWSLPRNNDFNSLLASLSTRLINRYLVIRVIECPITLLPEGSSIPIMFYRSSAGATTFSSTTPLCTFAKPFVWYQHEGIESRSEELSNDDLSRWMDTMTLILDPNCKKRS